LQALGLVSVSALVAWVIFWIGTPAKEPLPDLFPMPSFSLTDQGGDTFGSSQLEGKVVVANFIFTRCPTVCPTLTARMAKIQGRVAGDEGVHLLSFSVDPRHDTPEVLREFGEKFGQNPTRWSFLTGDVQVVTRAVEEGFKGGMKGADDPDATPFDIVHGEHFVLVDAKGSIRGYYPSDEDSLGRLLSDIARLRKEGGS
jgi:protein SCO1/2